jgi:hypothetical protein
MANDGWKAPVVVATVGLIGILGTAVLGSWARRDPGASPSPSPIGPSASAEVAEASPSPSASTSPSPPPPSASPKKPTPTPKKATPTPPPVRVAVANVYNQTESQGLAKIRAQGFTNIRPVGVCSSSVGPGHIRQVLVDDGGAPGATILVDKGGSTGIKVRLSTKLEVKIGNGNPYP